MRVAIVTETFLPNVNGIVRMLLAYLHYLEQKGHDAIVFAPGDGPRSSYGFQVIRVNGAPFLLYPGVILAPYSTRLGPTLRAWRPDIVHLAGPFVLGMHGLNVAQSLDIPVAAHYQTDIARYAAHFGLGALAGLAWRRLIDIHNRCEVTFAPTSSVADDLRAHGIRRVAVCGRGVDIELFHPHRRAEHLRRSIGAAPDQPVLLYVGRLSPEKNLGILAAVARALPDYPLLIVGDGPARAALEAELAGTNVHFTGTLHETALAATYASCDVFIFPSATETFGQVVREAMASGLAVVGVRSGGVQDLIEDGLTGYLCPADDADAFITAVRTVAENDDTRQRMGAAARDDAEQHTWTAVFDRLMGWYAGLANQKTRQPELVSSLR